MAALPVVWAECSTCPKDDDGHIMSEEDCSCGIYSAYRIETVSYYVDGENYVPILIEALGTYWFHYKQYDDVERPGGLTSSGAQVIAVIKDFRNHNHEGNPTPEPWIRALGHYYNVPLLTLEQGDELIAWAWDRFVPSEEKELEGRLIDL